jgi:hypothetical protein
MLSYETWQSLHFTSPYILVFYIHHLVALVRLVKPATMLLPRPARLLRQCPSLLYRFTPSPFTGQTRKYAATATARRVVPGSAEVEIDESYRHLLDDMRMQGSYKDHAGAGLRSEQSMRYRSEPGYAAAPELLGEDDEYPAEWEPREERRSPAAVLGSKRIGLVVLPEQLVDGVQSEINGMSVAQHSHLVKRGMESNDDWRSYERYTSHRCTKSCLPSGT